MKSLWNNRLSLHDMDLILPKKELEKIRYVYLGPDEKVIENPDKGKESEIIIREPTLLNFSFAFKNNPRDIKVVEYLFKPPNVRLEVWTPPCFFVKPSPESKRRLVITHVSWDKYYSRRFTGRGKEKLWRKLKNKESLEERGRQTEFFS